MTTVKKFYTTIKKRNLMIEKKTLARPYAKAIFETAEAKHEFEKWSEMLNGLAAVAKDPQIGKWLSDHSIAPAELTELFTAALNNTLNEEAKELIRMLSERRRLMILPEIAELYAQLREEAEKMLRGTCVTAIPLTEAQTKHFSAVLEKHLGYRVQLSCHVDPSLVGGFIIQAGDRVIDGSLLGRLNKLKEAMGG